MALIDFVPVGQRISASGHWSAVLSFLGFDRTDANLRRGAGGYGSNAPRSTSRPKLAGPDPRDQHYLRDIDGL